jgi:GNAT superfamily N-acetyltransferase
MLVRCYQELLDAAPEFAASEKPGWYDYDREAFARPDTVGACAFVTLVGETVVGFGSWEPVLVRKLGFVGHNCILPECQGQGCGARQLEEIVRRMQAQGIRSIRVTTSEHPFFEPARRMYRSFGFAETGRRTGGPLAGQRLVDYELVIAGQ